MPSRHVLEMFLQHGVRDALALQGNALHQFPFLMKHLSFLYRHPLHLHSITHKHRDDLLHVLIFSDEENVFSLSLQVQDFFPHY